MTWRPVFFTSFHLTLAYFSLQYPFIKEVKSKKFLYDFYSFCL